MTLFLAFLTVLFSVLSLHIVFPFGYILGILILLGGTFLSCRQARKKYDEHYKKFGPIYAELTKG